MRILKFFFPVLGAVLLASCSAVHKWQQNSTSADDYRDVAPLRVPVDMSYLKAENYYPIPSLDQTVSRRSAPIDQEKLMLPPGSMAAKLGTSKTRAK